MLNKMFTRLPRLEHADPAQRLLGLAELPPDSEDVAHLMVMDPAPSVRAAAARHCANLDALARALGSETEPEVRNAVASALAGALAEAPESERVATLLQTDSLTDSLRADVARRAPDGASRAARTRC